MIETPKIDMFLGSIATVVDRLSYEVTVNIPGFCDGLKAYPKSRGEMDEPKEGDVVMLMSLDPVYHSVLLYEKLKEDQFIGFRSNGKMLEITPDYIKIGIYNREDSFPDAYVPTPDSEVLIDKDGNITLKSMSNVSINCESDVEIKSNTGDVVINTKGDITLKSPTIKLDGDVSLTSGHKFSLANPTSAAFNTIKACPFGNVHGTNVVVS